ncbi:MAG TPA: ketol-acid reductoisomerase [Candidatus Krumholzibacteria bacterium]|nr:ketol-acid reductoisomerase [Candidatus Krumholzibacteria bacterium]
MERPIFSRLPPPPGTVIEADQAHPGPLRGLRVAIVGYGTMGRAHALNLRRSGVPVVVGARPGSARGDLARQEGFTVLDTPGAVAAGDVVMLMLPDHAMAGVYAAEVAPHLKPGAALGFAHGFAVAFGQVAPEAGRPCFLAAPKGQGDMLVEAHEQGGGVPGLLAVADGSPDATWELAAAYAGAVGCLVGGGFVTTFRAECISDQFGEQAVLCGGVIELLKAAFGVLVEHGYGEENAYFECIHELKLITDLLHRHGLDGMRRRISGTAAYGGLTRGPRVIDDGVRERMRTVLAEIESGAFARELLARHADPADGTAALVAREAADPLVAAGRRVLPRLHPEPDSSEETR